MVLCRVPQAVTEVTGGTAVLSPDLTGEGAASELRTCSAPASQQGTLLAVAILHSIPPSCPLLVTRKDRSHHPQGEGLTPSRARFQEVPHQGTPLASLNPHPPGSLVEGDLLWSRPSRLPMRCGHQTQSAQALHWLRALGSQLWPGTSSPPGGLGWCLLLGRVGRRLACRVSAAHRQTSCMGPRHPLRPL